VLGLNYGRNEVKLVGFDLKLKSGRVIPGWVSILTTNHLNVHNFQLEHPFSTRFSPTFS